MTNQKFKLGEAVRDVMTQRTGTVEGIAVYRFDPTQYYFHYTDKKDEHCTDWIAESRLESITE